jgi:hypothetical protein
MAWANHARGLREQLLWSLVLRFTGKPLSAELRQRNTYLGKLAEQRGYAWL